MYFLKNARCQSLCNASSSLQVNVSDNKCLIWTLWWLASVVVGLTGYGSDSDEEEEEEEPDSDEDLEERIRQKKEAFERKIKEAGIYDEDELGTDRYYF